MKTSLVQPKMAALSGPTKSGMKTASLTATAAAIGINPVQIKSSKSIKREDQYLKQ